MSPEDFASSTNTNVIFNTGNNNLATRDVVISVEDDDIVETTQTFQVGIVSSDNVVSPGTTTVLIQDNDGKSLVLYFITSTS